MSTVRWSQIEAECGDFRDGFVATFRKYEGQDTDERDARGLVVKVTMSSFARHVGIPEQTFLRWVKGTGSSVIYPSDADAGYRGALSRTRNLPPERKAELARELLAEPEVAEHIFDAIEDKIADDPAATARVNQKAEQRRPTPPRHEPKRNALSAAASLTAYSAWVADGERVVSEVVADVLDGQADPALLTEPNRNLAVLLARLQSAADSNKDFDSALADILNGDER
jgi:hypothetical protein